tara:strand:+ start:890 stop:2059 length:1170 start_codon:yes stop_codon:yes gene_type:complete
MGGGLMQLVAYGAQDVYLTGNPQITFFKVVYRRHTNFAMEAIEQTWDGTSQGSNGRCSATISRNGDLVHRMYIQISGADNQNGVDNPGAVHVQDITLEIGGQMIDKQSGEWMEVWAELTEPNPSGARFTGANSGGTLFQKMSGMGGVNSDTGLTETDFWIPLQFWFCRNAGLALPLIALQYHEVKVILNHRIVSAWSAAAKQSLFCDYIYLDSDERRRFAQVSHEYLIEQVQEDSLTSNASNDLHFNHPVKEIIWTQAVSLTGVGGNGVTTSNSVGTGNYHLLLNGHERFAPRDYRYFTRTQVWQHHTGCGGLDSATAGTTSGAFDDTIAVYSFALKPEEHQPSGTCNFSRIDNAQLIATGTQNADLIFAVNYNVLRIMSGMGGLAYSN